MRRLTCCAILLAVCTVGCKEGKSTAPSADPNKPNEKRELKVKVIYKNKVHQDGTDKFTVDVDRENFNGPVVLDVRNLPTGVSVVTENLTVDPGKTSMVVTIKAAPDAPLVKDHVIQIVGKAKDEKDLPEAVAETKLDVLDKSDR